MRTAIVFLFVVSLFYSCQDAIKSAEWLEGHWVMEEGGLETHEDWIYKDGEWTGLGYSMDGEDSVFVERMRIFEHRDSLFFEVFLPNAIAPKYFRNISSDPELLDFYWPENDFPQHIIYSSHSDSLFVELSGVDRTVELRFARE